MTLQMHPQIVSGKETCTSPDHFAITPSDDTNFAYQVRGIFVGGAGVVQVVKPNGEVVAWTVPAGGYIDARAIRVNSTSTTATLMIGLY